MILVYLNQKKIKIQVMSEIFLYTGYIADFHKQTNKVTTKARKINQVTKKQRMKK